MVRKLQPDYFHLHWWHLIAGAFPIQYMCVLGTWLIAEPLLYQSSRFSIHRIQRTLDLNQNF